MHAMKAMQAALGILRKTAISTVAPFHLSLHVTVKLPSPVIQIPAAGAPKSVQPHARSYVCANPNSNNDENTPTLQI
jgi:hypothetical protein